MEAALYEVPYVRRFDNPLYADPIEADATFKELSIVSQLAVL